MRRDDAAAYRTPSAALAWLSTELRPAIMARWMLRPDDGDHSEIITLSLRDSGKASGHSLAMTLIKHSSIQRMTASSLSVI